MHLKIWRGLERCIWHLPLLGMDENCGWMPPFASCVAPVYIAEATASHGTLTERVYCCWVVRWELRGGVEVGGCWPLFWVTRGSQTEGAALNQPHIKFRHVLIPQHPVWLVNIEYCGHRDFGDFSVCFPGTSWEPWPSWLAWAPWTSWNERRQGK